jgi:hypothetical protein
MVEPSYAARMPGALTLKRAGELLARLLPAYGPVCAVSRFAGGSVTGAYRIEFADAGSVPVVLKIYEDGSPRFAAKESRALRFLTGHGLDISPRVLAFSKSAETLGGRPCLVCLIRPGRTLTELDAELTCAQRHEIYRQLGEVLKHQHAIPAGGYGDVNGHIRDPLPDNAAHMARMLDRELRRFRKNAADPALAGQVAAHVTEHASAFAECSRPAYCHGDVHEDKPPGRGRRGRHLLADRPARPGQHARGRPADGLRAPRRVLHARRRDENGRVALRLWHLRAAARPVARGLPLYRIALALELYNWYTISGETSELPALERELRKLFAEAAAEH